MRVLVPNRVAPGVDRGSTLGDREGVAGNEGGEEVVLVEVIMRGKILNFTLMFQYLVCWT